MRRLPAVALVLVTVLLPLLAAGCGDEDSSHGFVRCNDGYIIEYRGSAPDNACSAHGNVFSYYADVGEAGGLDAELDACRPNCPPPE